MDKIALLSLKLAPFFSKELAYWVLNNCLLNEAGLGKGSTPVAVGCSQELQREMPPFCGYSDCSFGGKLVSG